MYRIGIIVCRGAVQRWQRSCIDAVIATGFARIELAVELENPPLLRLPHGAKAAVEAAGIEAILEAAPLETNDTQTADAAAEPDLVPGNARLLTCRAEPVPGSGTHRLPRVECTAVSGHTLDVVLDLSGLRLAGVAGITTRYGVWGLHFGDPERYDGRDPGLREIAAGDLCTAAILYRAAEDGRVEVLREGWFKTRPTPRRNADSVLLRASRFPALVLGAMAESRTAPAALRHLRLQPPMAPPDLGERARGWTNVARAALDSLRRRFCRERWTIGIVGRSVEAIIRDRQLGSPRWLASQPDDRFYADPFLLDARGGRLDVLVEAARYAESQGYLARLAVDDAGRATEQALLRRPEHLSYPSILRDGDAVYVMPECWQSGRLSAYRLDPATGAMTHDGDLMVDMAVVDPTLVRHDGRWWLFCCDRHDLDTTNLYVFHAAHWRGPYLPHAQNPVKIDVRSSRPAGAFVALDGQLYRPAQDCALRYGNAVVINRVIELTESRFREEVVCVLRPDPDGPYPDGLHTFNGFGDTTVIDGQKLSFEPLAAIADRFARRRNRLRRDARG